MYQLVVNNAFGDYRRGDVIADVDVIADIEAGEHQADVLRVEAPHPHIAAIELAEAELALLNP